MAVADLSQRIIKHSQRVEALKRQSVSDPANAAEVPCDVLRELQLNLEELSAIDEELHLQNEELTKAQEALRESEEKYRTAIDFSCDCETWLSPEGDYIYVSPSCEHITGYSVDEFLKDPGLFEKIVHPDDRELYPRHFHKSDDEVVPVDFRIIARNGEERWISHVCQPVYSSDGRYLGRRASNRDITEQKRTEEALRKSEEMMNRAQEIAHLGSWELDLLNNRLYWSDEVYRIFGLEPQEFGATYEAFLDAVHPNDRAAVDAAYSGSLRDGRDTYEIEHRVVRKSNGEVRIVYEKCEHIRDGSGKIIRSVGMVQDITDLKQAGKEIESLAKFPDEDPNPIMRLASDSTIIYANKGSVSLLESWDSQVGQKVPDKYGNLILEVLRSGSGREIEILSGRATYSLVLAPIIERGYVNIYGRDITDLKMAEEALRESEQRYRLISENMADVVILHKPSPDISYVYVSPSAKTIIGYDPQELIGKSPFELISYIHPEDIEIVKKSYNNTVNQKKKDVSEYRVRKKDGSWVWAETIATPIFDPSGNLVYIQNTSRDITKRKLAETALKDSQQLMSNIISFLPEAILAIDLDGKVIIWNKAMEGLTGVDAREMLGKGEYEYSLPFYGIRRPILVDMVLKQQKDFEREYINLKREGTAVLGETFIPTFGKNGSYLLAKATALYDPAGRLVGAIESVRDMTERRLMERTLEKTRTELHIAAKIQKRFIPERTPNIKNFEIAAKSIPAMEVGGDFYDFISLPEGKYGLVIADVAGKSIPAALFMALSRTIVRANATHQSKTTEVLKNANRMIAADATAGMFVTLLYGILDGEAFTFDYAVAGHPPPLLFRSETSRFDGEAATGIALGAKEDVEYEERTIRFSHGDIAVLYTDGVTEAMNIKGELYGLSRLSDIVSEAHELSTEKLVDRVFDDISNFSRGSDLNDDITLIILKACENNGKNFEILIPAKKEEIPKVVSFIKNIMSLAGFSGKDVLDVELAVEEATINIINHGYREAECTILVKCDLGVDRLTVIIEDEAHQFDPTRFDKPNLVRDLDKRPTGGLGIYLIKSLTDDLRYEYQGGKNRLILSKVKSSEPQIEQSIDQKRPESR
jgi:PAS domain S-box-containing protein